MAWREAFRTSTFRTAAIASSVFGIGTLLLFAFIYWQTAGLEAQRIARSVLNESAAISRERPGDIARDVQTRFAGDLHRLTFAALFTAGRRMVAGDLSGFPEDLAVDGKVHIAGVARTTPTGPARERATIAAHTLPDGRILVVGRSNREVTQLRTLVARALLLGLIPAILVALGAGIWASLRTLARVAAFRLALERIIEGGLKDRLPARPEGDTLDILAASVNGMLEQLQHLVVELRGVGDNIAHDLRTPLTRMRARLEGGRRRAIRLEDLDEVVTRAIADLDQCFSLITALLRIGEIEGAQRRAGFSAVSLNAILHEACDLYQPMAELKNVEFSCSSNSEHSVQGDRDLLFEMYANLVDNAIKFVPPGGLVRLELLVSGATPVLRVADGGAGIAPQERDRVLQRFYRSTTAGSVSGHGLGLSLVAAIVRLHGFSIAMHDLTPGFAVDVLCHSTHPGLGERRLELQPNEKERKVLLL